MSRMSSSGSGVSRKVSDADIFGFIKPREMEMMRPEKEPLLINDDTIPSGRIFGHDLIKEINIFRCDCISRYDWGYERESDVIAFIRRSHD